MAEVKQPQPFTSVRPDSETFGNLHELICGSSTNSEREEGNHTGTLMDTKRAEAAAMAIRTNNFDNSDPVNLIIPY